MNKSIFDFLKDFFDKAKKERYWGTLTITFQNGEVQFLVKNETIKIK